MRRFLAVALFIIALFGVHQSAYAMDASTFDHNLYYGLRNDTDVTELQNLLINQGYLQEGNNTGYFGAVTQSAVRSYQASKGIDTTGYVGPLTRGSLSQNMSISIPSRPTDPTVTTPGIPVQIGGGIVQPTYTILSFSIQKGASSMQNGVSTNTVSATFNVQVQAKSSDVVLSVGSQMQNSFVFSIVKDGQVVYPNVASTMAASLPSMGTSNVSYTVPKNTTVTIPVTFLFEGRLRSGQNVPYGNYSVELTQITSSLGTSSIKQRTDTMTLGETGATSPGSPSVILGVNGTLSTGYQEPVTVVSNPTSAVPINWSATNASYCNTYGQQQVLMTDGTLWNNHNLPTSGSKAFVPANQSYPNAANITTIGIQCWSNTNTQLSDSKGIAVTWASNNTAITPLTPAGGETYAQGQSFNIRWGGTDYGWPSHDLYVVDNRAGGTRSLRYIGTASISAKDVQAFNWTIPSDLAPGFGYQIQFGKEAAGFSGAFGVSAGTSQTPTVTVTASPTVITAGQSSTVTWSSNTATCSVGNNAPSGSEIVSPTQTTTYGVYCYNSTADRVNAAPSTYSSVTVTVTPGTGSGANADPYTSPNYNQTSNTPLGSTEKAVTYTYDSSPCGSLMTFATPGSVSVGRGPVYNSASQICSSSGQIPNDASFRVYACQNVANPSSGLVRGQATFGFQCTVPGQGAAAISSSAILDLFTKYGLMPL